MFGSDLGMTIVWGLVISFVGFFGTYFLLRKWTEKEWIEPNPEFVRGMEETDSDSVDDILIKDPGLPHTGEGFLPLLLPVLLISVSSFAQMYAAEGSAIYTIWHHHRQQGHRSVHRPAVLLLSGLQAAQDGAGRVRRHLQ